MVIQRVLASARVARVSEVQGNPSDSWGFMVDFHSRRLS